MTLTLQDIKTLESLFIVEMHAAERIFRLVENGMADIYRESKDYKKLVKQYGKPAADKIVTTYSSPCQDFSKAGKQASVARSSTKCLATPSSFHVCTIFGADSGSTHISPPSHSSNMIIKKQK